MSASFESTLIRQSPLALGIKASRGRWRPFEHLIYLDRFLSLLIRGNLRLIVEMPPRHGKSELISHYVPAWHVLRWPNKRVLLASYQDDFAAQWGRKARDVVEEFGGAYGIRVMASSKAASRWDIAGYDGGMATAGMGGALTGKGAHLLIIDDPIKNEEESNSQTIRDKHWEWYRSTARTRLQKNGSIIVVMTRWHEDDLVGRLLQAQQDDGEKWIVVRFPAIAEEDEDWGHMTRRAGEPLCADLFPLPELLRLKSTVGSYWWSGLFQQRPAPAEGGTFKRDWLKQRWHVEGEWITFTLKNGERRQISPWSLTRFITVDLATSIKETADYTVVSVWGYTPDNPPNLLMLDQFRERVEGPDILPAIHRMVDRWKVPAAFVESVGFQLSVIQSGRRAVPGRPALPLRELTVDKDKQSRALLATAVMERGSFFLPANAPWLPAYEAELLSFPKGAHDDQVDATSAAARVLFEYGGGADAGHVAAAPSQIPWAGYAPPARAQDLADFFPAPPLD